MSSSRNILKGWFSTGKKPLATQFAEWMDSFWHKDEDAIPIASIAGLQNALNNKADKVPGTTIVLNPGTAYYDITAGAVLEKIWFQLTTATAISVGKTAGATDVYEQGADGINGDILMTGDRPFRQAARIYFNGIQPDTVTIIYKR